MTTPPVDPEPPTDMEDPDSSAIPPDDKGKSDEGAGDDSDGTDAMGIDDDDPIDSTLVGSPVDDDAHDGRHNGQDD